MIYLSFATLKKPRDVDVFVKASGKDLKEVRKDLVSHYPSSDPLADKGKPAHSELTFVDTSFKKERV